MFVAEDAVLRAKVFLFAVSVNLGKVLCAIVKAYMLHNAR
jgi:hypothetical protein